jgi:hypothetical protein
MELYHWTRLWKLKKYFTKFIIRYKMSYSKYLKFEMAWIRRFRKRINWRRGLNRSNCRTCWHLMQQYWVRNQGSKILYKMPNKWRGNWS